MLFASTRVTLILWKTRSKWLGLWLIRWLIGWLIDWLVGWLVRWLVDSLDGWIGVCSDSKYQNFKHQVDGRTLPLEMRLQMFQLGLRVANKTHWSDTECWILAGTNESNKVTLHSSYVHPPSLTYPLKNGGWKTTFLLGGNFSGAMLNFGWVAGQHLIRKPQRMKIKSAKRVEFFRIATLTIVFRGFLWNLKFSDQKTQEFEGFVTPTTNCSFLEGTLVEQGPWYSLTSLIFPKMISNDTHTHIHMQVKPQLSCTYWFKKK